MIDFLKGKVVHIESTYVVLDVNDVGYRVFCSNPYAFQPNGEGEHTFYIHHHVREDAILLYGFATREEQTLFRRLIEVSGIGPRVASGIMSGAHPAAIIASIQQEDINFLVTLPGIGRKTAQRMILDLKDKLEGIIIEGEAGADASGADQSDQAEARITTPSASNGNSWEEAKEALLALGYTEAELNRCWLDIRGKVQAGDSVDAIMKLALQALFKG